MASRQLLIPRTAAVGTSFSPLPCQAWHGYGVTNAHRVEVEVGADGHASASLSGATAGGREEQTAHTNMLCSLFACAGGSASGVRDKLVTSGCTMSCNVLLHDKTRHI
jgi:hypothetical protein